MAMNMNFMHEIFCTKVTDINVQIHFSAFSAFAHQHLSNTPTPPPETCCFIVGLERAS